MREHFKSYSHMDCKDCKDCKVVCCRDCMVGYKDYIKSMEDSTSIDSSTRIRLVYCE
jgi:hypothetical protein